MVKVVEMLSELSTWSSFSDTEIAAAARSKINTGNSKEFAKFVSHWKIGAYDEDPHEAAVELRRFINKK
jgi:hypothetical protein